MNPTGWTVLLRPYAVIWLILVAAVTFLAYRSYLSTIPPVSDRRRHLLLGLRLTTLGVLAIVALGPRIEWHGIKKRPLRVSVLVDQSESMSFTDSHGQRPETVRNILGGPGMERVRSDADVEFYGIGASVTRIDPDALSFNSPGTAIGEAILEQRRTVPPPDLVVLISDGVNTTGTDPVRAASEVDLPIWTIGVGADSPQKDLRIVSVTAPEVALAGKPMTVAVTVDNSGLPSGGVQLSALDRNGDTITSRSVRIPEMGLRADYELTVVPTVEGVFRATVVIDSIAGEVQVQNNARTFSTKVLKGQRRAVILTGAPSPDVSQWVRTFSQRDDFEVSLWIVALPNQTGSRNRTGPPDAELLADADLIIWHDVPPQAVPTEITERVAQLVRDGSGMLVVPGRYTLPSAIDAVTPISGSRGRLVSRMERSRLSSDAANHPVYRDDLEYPRWSLNWNENPPLLARTIGMFAETNSVVLLDGETEPLAIAGTADAGRVVAFLGAAYWRWTMIPAGLGVEEPPAKGFWNAVVLWLGTRQPLSRVQLQTSSPLYRPGQPVRVTAQVYTAEYTPLEGAAVRIEVDDGAVAAEAKPIGEGRYVADVTGLGAGDHLVTASAAISGSPVGTASVEFTVSRVGIEHEKVRQQRGVLEAIATASATVANGATVGAYVSSAHADSLLLAIDLASVSEPFERSVDVGRWPWLLLVVIATLTAEWILRRVRGLL
jgi:hypothetical protein